MARPLWLVYGLCRSVTFRSRDQVTIGLPRPSGLLVRAVFAIGLSIRTPAAVSVLRRRLPVNCSFNRTCATKRCNWTAYRFRRNTGFFVDASRTTSLETLGSCWAGNSTKGRLFAAR